MFYLWLVVPIMLAFYETEASQTFCSRIWQAFRVQLPLFIFLLLMTIPTYFFLNETVIPADQLDYTNLEVNDQKDGEEYFIDDMNFPIHLYVVTTWIGLLLVAIFGGIGLIFLPYNLLNDWIFRPKPINESDFKKRQKILLPKLINLRKEGKHLENDRM